MNPRFLQAEQQLAMENHDLFWGLLYDIRQCFGGNYNSADVSKSRRNGNGNGNT